MAREQRIVQWPGGADFAFTVFDDPDGQSLDCNKIVYSFLEDLGLKTTVAVWPGGATSSANSGGETCDNIRYVDQLAYLASRGFEIGYHLPSPHDCLRAASERALEKFLEMFGEYPRSMANHYNAEAIYWGDARLSGALRIAYKLLTAGRTSGRHTGHIETSPFFWGDLCREKVTYCRNFVFADLNTLRACPQMPYHDPNRPWVNRWFAASEGAQGRSFVSAIAESHQDRLAEQGGACILYTHFGHGFVDSNGRLNPDFKRLMLRLAKMRGWFVPASTILDHLASAQGVPVLTDSQRRSLEGRWLFEKIFRGTS